MKRTSHLWVWCAITIVRWFNNCDLQVSLGGGYFGNSLGIFLDNTLLGNVNHKLSGYYTKLVVLSRNFRYDTY